MIITIIYYDIMIITMIYYDTMRISITTIIILWLLYDYAYSYRSSTTLLQYCRIITHISESIAVTSSRVLIL